MSLLPPLLLIDDGADDRELVSLVLAGAFGEVQIEAAADAAALARAVSAGRFGAVLTEHELAWIRSGDVLRLIRDLRPDCPVIVVTGRPLERVAAEILHLAPDGLIPKTASGLVGLPRVLRAALVGARRRALAEAGEAPARRLLDALPAGVLVASEEGTLLDANPALAALLGYADAADCTHRPLAELFVATGDFEALRASLVPGAPAVAVETRLRRADGGTLRARVTAWRAVDDGLIQATVEDRSAALDAELALERRGAELARSNAELEEMAYVVSHDLNQPLGQIVRYLDLLGEEAGGRLGGEGKGLLEQARQSAARLETMVDGVLSWARIESRGRSFAPVDLAALAARVVERLRAESAAADAEISVGALPTLPGDEAQLEQLLYNLLDNALKFRGAEPPRVEIDALDAGDAWQLRVRDNGIGLDPKNGERIFAMFQRLHTAGERPGTGIGLAVCRRVVARHGGRIWVESRPGAGATFHFTLAKRPAAAARSESGE